MEQGGDSAVLEQLSIIRGSLKPPPAREEEIGRVYCGLMGCLKGIRDHIGMLGRAIEEGEQGLWGQVEGKRVGSKVLLYAWQVINYIIIGGGTYVEQVAPLIGQMLQTTIDYDSFQPHNCLKNASICLLNYIKQIKESKNHLQISEWVQQILTYHFNPTRHPSPLSHSFPPKSEEVLITQMEWISYIFEAYSQLHHPHPFQTITTHNPNCPKVAYYWLHMLGNQLQRIIDLRTTTEIVQGIESPLKDVRQMYQNKQQLLLQCKITQQDLIYLVKLLQKETDQHKALLQHYLSQHSQPEWVQYKWQTEFEANTQLLLEMLHVLNCALFLGGYNSPVQNIVIPYLLKQQALLGLFQLSFMVSRSILACGKLAKVTVMVEVGRQSQQKLHQILHLPPPAIPLTLKQLQPVWKQGLLISSVRLMTNLIHINHQAQSVFQEAPKYLHMVMSLTHESGMATLKEWAIMFIRNVSESSEKMREEISKVKVEMKVTQ